MANMPDVNNVLRAVRTPRTLDAKITKKYQQEGMTIKDAYILALMYATRNVDLDPEDYERIAAEVREARMNRGKISK